MDRQQFEAALDAELARWEELVSALTEEQAMVPGALDAWSVRDVVLHVAFWTQHAAAHLTAIAEGRAPTEAELYGQSPPPPEVARDDDDAINAWVLAQAGAVPFDAALALGQQAAQNLRDALARLDDATLLDRQRQFPGLPWKGERTLLEVLDVLTLDHAVEHREALAAWLATQPPPSRDAALRRELLAMRDRDQELRQQLMAQLRPGESPDQALVEQLQAVDRANTARMQAIVAEHGWPGRSLVGTDGAAAAWLLVQHADADRAVQERCLALLQTAVAAGEAEPADLAYLFWAMPGSSPSRRGPLTACTASGCCTSSPVRQRTRTWRQSSLRRGASCGPAARSASPCSPASPRMDSPTSGSSPRRCSRSLPSPRWRCR